MQRPILYGIAHAVSKGRSHKFINSQNIVVIWYKETTILVNDNVNILSTNLIHVFALCKQSRLIQISWYFHTLQGINKDCHLILTPSQLECLVGYILKEAAGHIADIKGLTTLTVREESEL